MVVAIESVGDVAVSGDADVLVFISPEKVHPTLDNKRRIDEGSEKFKQLEASIEKHGMRVPPCGRPSPHSEGMIEIRDGECRWRAAQNVGLAVMPVLVRVMDDHEAMAVTLLANEERSDLHPIEEAETYAAALLKGWTAREISEKQGKSLQHVARRLAIAGMADCWKSAAFDGDSGAAGWTMGQWEQLAKLPVDSQERLYREIGGYDLSEYDAGSLRRIIADKTHFLDAAPWKLSDRSLAPALGSCTGCIRRSDCQPELFDGDDFLNAPEGKGSKKTGALCLDSECWDAKFRAWLEQYEAKLRQTYPNLVLLGSPRQGVQSSSHWERCGKRDAGATPCLWVDYGDAGKFGWARRFDWEGEEREKAPKKEQSAEEKAAALARKRRGYVVGRLIEALQRVVNTGAEDNPVLEELGTFRLCGLLLAFGTVYRRVGKDEDPWAVYSSWADEDENSHDFSDVTFNRVGLAAVETLLQRLRGLGEDLPANEEGFVAGLFGLDLAALEAEALEKIGPEAGK